jgi:hypothetical protein
MEIALFYHNIVTPTTKVAMEQNKIVIDMDLL